MSGLASNAIPVMFPAGCARLWTKFWPTGSPALTKTMGIEVVASLAARVAADANRDDYIDLEMDQLGSRIR